MTLVVNLFGGPGAGKSTLAAGVFYQLKQAGVNVEFVHEFAKELAWESREGSLSNQVWILGQQFEMFRRCMEHVDVIVTDTSLLNSAIYCHNYGLPYADDIERLALSMHRSMNNLTFYVRRKYPYVEVGRYQDETGANEVAQRVLDYLVDNQIGFAEVPGSDVGITRVYDDVRRALEL